MTNERQAIEKLLEAHKLALKALKRAVRHTETLRVISLNQACLDILHAIEALEDSV